MRILIDKIKRFLLISLQIDFDLGNKVKLPKDYICTIKCISRIQSFFGFNNENIRINKEFY